MKPPEGKRGPTPPLEDGLQKARCYLMAYVGVCEDDYQGKITKRPKVILGFLYPEHTFDFYGDGEELPYSKCKTYTFNLGRKANLRKDLEKWRGQKWKEDWPDFDLTKVLGTAVLHNIIHNENGDKFYIDGLIKIKSQSECPPLANDPIMYDIREHDHDVFETLPKWIQDMAMESEDWISTFGKVVKAGEDSGIPDEDCSHDDPVVEEEEDDIPF